MDIGIQQSTFPLLWDVPTDDRELSTISPFTVSAKHGFLPISAPPTELPCSFAALASLLDRMPIRTMDGKPGLLATYKLGESVLQELPDLTREVELFKDDLRITGALYRDYSFLASAYLLEPCHERHVNGDGYGLGRQRLPAVLARPLARVAELYVYFRP